MPATSTTATPSTSKTAPSAPPPAQTQNTSEEPRAELVVRFYEGRKPEIELVRGENINNAKLEQMFVGVYRAVGQTKAAARAARMRADQKAQQEANK